MNLLQEKRLFLAKKKISIEIMSYVYCIQCMQHIFNKHSNSDHLNDTFNEHTESISSCDIIEKLNERERK